METIICHLLGHKYRLLRKISPTTRELICKRCKAQFGMNDDAKAILPLDKELIELHSWIKQPLSTQIQKPKTAGIINLVMAPNLTLTER